MSEQNDAAERREQLSDAKRALLLRRLQGKKPGEGKTEGIRPRPLTGPLPLSFTQQRVWFLQQLYPDNTAYNMHESWRVRGPLNLAALQKALNEVVARHAALRTRFVAANGDEPQQIIESSLLLEIPLIDLMYLTPEAREAELRSLALAEGNRAFDLDRAPLLRLVAVRLGGQDNALLLTFHHIITDEWSNDVFWRELSVAYGRAAGLGGDKPAALAIQYPDFAAWQREQVAAGALDGQLAYWREQLGGELPLLGLPHDRPRPATQSLRGGVVRQSAPDGLLSGLQALSQRHGATLYMTLLAAFQLLLHRYSAQEDILVGTPIANRQRPETAGVMGMFINTAVIRADFAANPTFAQLLAQVREKVLAALAHQDLPFDVLVQAIQPERDLSHNPLFQSMFVFNSDAGTRALPGLTLEHIPLDRGVAKFDLTMLAGEENGRLVSAVEYNSDLFDRATAARFLVHWQHLLAAVVANPEVPAAALPLLGDGERETVLVKWNDTAVPLGDPLCLHQVIHEHALRDPLAPAVISGDEQLSYGQLEERANRLAHCLRGQGVEPGTPVGLFVTRSTAMVVGILGILKAGGAYVPLEPAYPAERVAYVLGDTRTPLVVTEAAHAGQLPASAARIVTLESVLAEDSGWPVTDPATDVGLGGLAYIIYTSGTTGTPKGVMVTHSNLWASTLARKITYDEPVGLFLLLSSFAFDSSVAGIFWTLATGGALVLPAPDEEKDVLRLAAIAAEHQVTHTLALPSLYRLLLAYAPPGALDTLRVVIVAGEACPPDLGALHGRYLPHATLYNEYGPTEATVWCSVYQVPPLASEGPVPIGRPISNYQLYILDAQQQPLPVGVPGELYVGGAGVTRGYWDHPSLTEERFPHLNIPGHPRIGRVYRTGDLARWRADGQIEFLGRVDNQVKIRGYRIEPGEIEALLQGHPAVHEAAVVVWEESGPGAPEKSLVGYVTADATADPAALRAYLAAQMPDYMLPRQIIPLAALPRTPNGKIDRRALPPPARERAGERPFIPPSTLEEQILARIWADILRLPQVSTADKFFELGGDSLLSIQVIARARQEGLLLTPRQLFQEQTIARLAAVAVPAVAVAAPEEVAGPVPLTPIQQWFFDQDLPDPAHWNQAAWFETAVPFDPRQLHTALSVLAHRHPQLRARFFVGDDGWQQETLSEIEMPQPEFISLAGLSHADQEAALEAEANRLHATLDLQEGPLLRSAVFDLGDGRPPRLLLILHHLIVDTVSWGILSADLATAYQQTAAGKMPDLPAPPATFKQWALTGLAVAQSGTLEKDVAYWRRVSSTVPSLPRDYKSPLNNTEDRAAVVTVSLPVDATAQLLRDVHEAYHTRVEDLLLAALVRTVASWTEHSAALVMLERHGREELDPHLDVSETVGWFTALIPLTLELAEGGDPGADVRAVKEQLRAVPHNGVSYGLLRYHGVEDLREELARRPQPEILFNYLGQSRRASGQGALLRPLLAGIGQAYGPSNTRAHLLDINARVEDGYLRVNWQYPTTVFRLETIQHLAERYVAELQLLISHCLDVERGRYTPSDFPLAGLQQDDLDSLSDLLSGLG